MTTWADVFVELAGAPVGAGITVLGIALATRYHQGTQRELLASTEAQQRARMDFDLRQEHLRHTLRERGDIYESALGLCDRAKFFSAWGAADPPPYDSGPLRNTDLADFKRAVTTLRYRVQVHCSDALRREVARFDAAVASSGAESGRAHWHDLARRADGFHEQVIQAAVKDRTSGLVEDGAGEL